PSRPGRAARPTSGGIRKTSSQPRLQVRSPAHEPAAARHFVGDAGKRVAGSGFGQAAHFEQNHSGLDDGGPVFRLALTLTHARLSRDRGHRLVREHADIQPAFAADRVRRGDAPGFDRLRTEPAAFQRLQAELAEADLVTALRLTSYDAPLAFAELYPFG